jgi:hypothetical protein
MLQIQTIFQLLPKSLSRHIADNPCKRTLRKRSAIRIMTLMFMSVGGLEAATQPESSVSVLDFGVKPGSGQDATPAIRQAIEECRAKGIKRLVFPPGQYDMWPDRASEMQIFVSNNDSGLKRIGFPLVGVNGLEIDGSGASILFHGPMVPFFISGSQDITIRNLAFDFVRPIHSEGKVLAITPESVDVEFSEEFPFEIRNGVLVFTGPKPAPEATTTVKTGEVIYPYGNLLAFDAEKREPAYMAKDRYGLTEGVHAKEIGKRQVRLFVDRVTASPGDVLVFGPNRDYPGIIIEDSKNVLLEKVDIHHCGGMGVIAQRSADVFVHKVKVVPPEGSERVISITADATHFVNMTGRIELVDCVFENQKDDATNVHGLYARVTRRIAPDEIEVKLVHPQQFGVDFIKPGMRLELTQGPTLEPLGYAVAKEVTRINSEYTLVKTEEPMPKEFVEGDAVADADANTAEVLIKNCIIGKNRARGILLGSRGKMVIEGNTFHTPGAAILFEGDARYWFEQAGVRDVVIRKNVFDNCNYGVWGNSVIQVGTGMDKEARKTSTYNKNIVIEDNLFRVFDSIPLLNIYAVDGLKFCNNRLERTNAYPPRQKSAPEMFVVEGCANLQLEKPTEVAK